MIQISDKSLYFKGYPIKKQQNTAPLNNPVTSNTLNSVYLNGKLSQQIGITFQGGFLSGLRSSPEEKTLNMVLKNIKKDCPDRTLLEWEIQYILRGLKDNRLEFGEEHYKSVENSLELLLKAKDNDGKYFTEFRIGEILTKLGPETIDSLKTLLEIKTPDNKSRFNDTDIRDLIDVVSHLDNESPGYKYFEYLIKNIDFNGSQIKDLLENLDDKTEKYFKTLIDNERLVKSFQLDGLNIVEIFQALCKDYPVVSKHLNSLFHTNKDDKRFKGYNVASILTNLNDKNEKYLLPLIELKKDDKKEYKYSGSSIAILMESSAKGILNDKDLENVISGRIENIDLSKKIEILSNHRYDSAEIIQELSGSIISSFNTTKSLTADSIKKVLHSFENLDNSIKGANLETYAKTGLPLTSDKSKIDVNKVPANSKELVEDLNVIIEAFPEFKEIIGRKQHETHAYTLDIHMLKALQVFINDSEYNKLSENDKKLARLAIIFHDIDKKEGVVDPSHPDNSALKVYGMMQKLNLPVRDIERIYGIIRNHHWLQKISEKKIQHRDVAFEFRKPGDFEIAKLFAKADLKTIGNGFEEKLLPKLEEAIPIVQKQIDHIHKTGIFLPQTRIPAACELKTNETILSSPEGTTKNKVIKIDKNTNFEAAGFDKGTEYDNFTAIVHAIRPDNTDITRDIDYASIEGNNGIFSVSYITPDKFQTYQGLKSGFVFGVDPGNISNALYENLGSGYAKNLESLKNYVFRNQAVSEEIIKSRTAFSDNMKATGKLSDEEYAGLFKEISKYQSITDIKEEKTRKMVEKAAYKTMFNKTGNQNEAVVYAPKPMAIFTKEDSAEKVPHHLRKYAEEHNIPVLIYENH